MLIFMQKRDFIKYTLAGTGSLYLTGWGSFAASLQNSQTVIKITDEGYVQDLKKDIISWLETVRYKNEGWGRWKYNLNMARNYGLESSSHGIELLKTYDELDKIPAAKKKEALAFFLGCRDPKDGFIKDPLVKVKDKVSAHHTWEHIWAHMSGAGWSAVRNLGGTVPPKEKEAAPFVNLFKTDPKEWILSLNWTNPWLVGEHMSKAIDWYWNQLPPEQKNLDNPVVKTIFDTYEHYVVEPATGMPTKRGCTNKAVAMAGLFKTSSAYLKVGRKIPYPEKAMDSVLALQFPDGSFGYEKTRGIMTINWDSLWVIRTLDEQMAASYRRQDIKDSGNRLAAFLLKEHRKPDGGFSFNTTHCVTEHNSIRISDKYAESDTHGTVMCLKCLAYADEWNARG